MLGIAAMRFIRRKWPNVQQLAEELYATFRKGMTIEPGQIIIEQQAGDTRPPIVIRQPDDFTGPVIQVTRGGVNIDLGSSSGGGSGGGTDLGSIEFPSQDPDQVNLSVPDPSDNPITLYGEVRDKIGGQVYSVECWAKNPLTAPSIGILQVTAPAVDPDDTLPGGYAVLVLAFPGLDSNNARTIVAAVMCPAVYAPLEE